MPLTLPIPDANRRTNQENMGTFGLYRARHALGIRGRY